MLSPLDYLVLYENVHSKEVEKYIVRKKEIKYAIRNMVEVYKPDPTLWGKKIAQVANYDDPAYRCAYLYKYAPLHTCLVQDMFIRALTESAAVINPNFWSNNNCLNICNLGGGPGIDTIGVLSALHKKYGFLRCSAQIIESMPGWKDTFETILEEFKNRHFGLSANLTSQYFESSYIVADLLGKMDSAVNKAIGSANLITMVKFLSATTCIETGSMIRKIFNSMRHGAVVFIIDNASGGYSELVSRIAQECRMVPVFGPLEYVQYTNPIFNVRNYDSRSCYSTQVTVHLLMKPCAPPVIQWSSSLKPIIMDYKMKTDYCCSSEEGSTVSFGTSGYDSDFSNLKGFASKISLQSKTNTICRREDKNKTNTICRREDKCSANYDSNNGQPSMAFGSNFFSSKNELPMVSGSNICSVNNFAYKEDRFTSTDYKWPLKYSDNFENKPFDKVLNLEPIHSALAQISSLSDKSMSSVSEKDSRFNYPLYQLFPSNEDESRTFKNALTSSVEESFTMDNSNYAAPNFAIDFDKIPLREETETIQLTGNKNDTETKALLGSHNSVKNLKGGKEIKGECYSCSKLKRIKWLQKMCKFCNTQFETWQ